MKRIYLDNSLTTKPSEIAISAMQTYLSDLWGSPTAPHQMGQQLYPAMEEGYRALYSLIGAKESDTVLFTSSGAEAVNHVMLSVYFDVTTSTGKNQFMTSNIDEAPAIMSLDRLEKMGCISKMVQANREGYVSAQMIADQITPRTALITLSWANGLTGVMNPVSEIAALCKDRGILFHLDASHVLGKHYYELDEVGADFISFNGDTLHAPKGTGGLYIKSDVKCSPFILGGVEQGGMRAGTLNVPGLVAMGQAAREVLEGRDLLCMEVARLRNRLEEGIQAGFPEAVIFFQEGQRVPHVSCIGFPGMTNEALLYRLNRKGVCASIGGSNFQQIGHILTASEVEESLAHSAISFSLSRETTEEEIDRAIEIIVENAKQLKNITE